MTQSQPPVTRTTHTLPFEKLSPRDFERLCLWLVERKVTMLKDGCELVLHFDLDRPETAPA